MQWVGYQMAVAAVDKENVDLGSLESLASGDVRGTVMVKDASTSDSLPAGIRVRIVARELQALYTDTGPGRPDRTGRSSCITCSWAIMGFAWTCLRVTT